MSEATTTQLPAHIQERLNAQEGPKGADGVGDFRSMPRLKVVQATAQDEAMIDRHGFGGVLIHPDDQSVAKIEEPFQFAVAKFFPTWACWYDTDDKRPTPVAAETHDRNHPIAQRAMSGQYEMDYPDHPKFVYSFAEHLNFIVMILSGPAKGCFALLTFSKGSHKIGKKLCGIIDNRAQTVGLDIFLNRFEGFTEKRANPEGKPYYALIAQACMSDPYTSPEDIEKLEAEFEGTDVRALIPDTGGSDVVQLAMQQSAGALPVAE